MANNDDCSSPLVMVRIGWSKEKTELKRSAAKKRQVIVPTHITTNTAFQKLSAFRIESLTLIRHRHSIFLE
jgi:hypothetical protein